MKALSIRQPWAWLIVNGLKDVENRDWKYSPSYTGPLLIHAAKGCTKDEYESAVITAKGIDPNIQIPPLSELERGGIVGKVFMEGVVTRSLSPWFFGRLGFVFSRAEKIDFEPCKGQLGFFKPDIPFIEITSLSSVGPEYIIGEHKHHWDEVGCICVICGFDRARFETEQLDLPPDHREPAPSCTGLPPGKIESI